MHADTEDGWLYNTGMEVKLVVMAATLKPARTMFPAWTLSLPLAR